MPTWNGSTGITEAQAESACAGAITAAGLPDAAAVEVAAEAGADAAIASASLATAADVTAGTAAVIAGVPDNADIAAQTEVGAGAAIDARNDEIQIGFAAAVGAGTTKALSNMGAPGPGFRFAIYGWHALVFAAVSDVAIATDDSVEIGKSMPIGSVSAVASQYPLAYTQENFAASLVKTIGASVFLTVFFKVVPA